MIFAIANQKIYIDYTFEIKNLRAVLSALNSTSYYYIICSHYRLYLIDEILFAVYAFAIHLRFVAVVHLEYYGIDSREEFYHFQNLSVHYSVVNLYKNFLPACYDGFFALFLIIIFLFAFMPRLTIENVEIDSSVVAFYSSLYHDDIVVDKKISVSLVSLGEKHAFHFAVEIFYCRIRHDSPALRCLFLYL